MTRFFRSYCYYRVLHSFPTRRSSDLRHSLSIEDASRTVGAGPRNPAAQSTGRGDALRGHPGATTYHWPAMPEPTPDRKSTRLNSSHLGISYAVFCLKKKKNQRDASRL